MGIFSSVCIALGPPGRAAVPGIKKDVALDGLQKKGYFFCLYRLRVLNLGTAVESGDGHLQRNEVPTVTDKGARFARRSARKPPYLTIS